MLSIVVKRASLMCINMIWLCQLVAIVLVAIALGLAPVSLGPAPDDRPVQGGTFADLDCGAGPEWCAGSPCGGEPCDLGAGGCCPGPSSGSCAHCACCAHPNAAPALLAALLLGPAPVILRFAAHTSGTYPPGYSVPPFRPPSL